MAPADRRCGGAVLDERSSAGPVSFRGLLGGELANLIRQLGRKTRDRLASAVATGGRPRGTLRYIGETLREFDPPRIARLLRRQELVS